jgi:hypothetical protein
MQCIRKVAVQLGCGTAAVQACIDARGHHFQHLLYVHSDFPNTLYIPRYTHVKLQNKAVLCDASCISERTSHLTYIAKCPWFKLYVADSF